MIKFLVILLVFRLVYPIESVNILVLENLASKSDHLWLVLITVEYIKNVLMQHELLPSYAGLKQLHRHWCSRGTMSLG